MNKRIIILAALAAGLSIASAAQADPLLARSECIGGFWHVVTYDIGNPNNWIVVDDQPTGQPCGGQATLSFFLGGRERGFGHLLHSQGEEHRFFAEGGREHVRMETRTVEGSRHANMKELRASTTRVLFAFDPTRSAILLIGGDKRDRWQ